MIFRDSFEKSGHNLYEYSKNELWIVCVVVKLWSKTGLTTIISLKSGGVFGLVAKRKAIT
jgi:hypothetical protein